MKSLLISLFFATTIGFFPFTTLQSSPSEMTSHEKQSSVHHLRERASSRLNQFRRLSHSRQEQTCATGPTGPTGPMGEVGATGPKGHEGHLCEEYGNFFTHSQETLEVGEAIPYFLPGLSTRDINLVTDITFHGNLSGQIAVAVSRPGIYAVTFGVSSSTSGTVVLALNGVHFANSLIAVGDGQMVIMKTIIPITENNILNGQGGAALLEVLVTSPQAGITLGSAGGNTAIINLIRIGDICEMRDHDPYSF